MIYKLSFTIEDQVQAKNRAEAFRKFVNRNPFLLDYDAPYIDEHIKGYYDEQREGYDEQRN